jgi:hypothetical protein
MFRPVAAGRQSVHRIGRPPRELLPIDPVNERFFDQMPKKLCAGVDGQVRGTVKAASPEARNRRGRAPRPRQGGWMLRPAAEEG